MYRLPQLHSLFALPVLWLLLPFVAFEPPPNSPPVAADDSYTRHGNGVVGPVLANDYDPDGDVMGASVVTSPSRGTLYGLSPGRWNYTLTDSSWTGELRMREQSHRHMERFWGTVLVGSVVGGAVIIGGPSVVLPLIRVAPRAAPIFAH